MNILVVIVEKYSKFDINFLIVRQHIVINAFQDIGGKMERYFLNSIRAAQNLLLHYNDIFVNNRILNFVCRLLI